MRVSYFLAFAGFAALIILHELGHFTAARAVGMRVERFSLFFPPHFWKVRRGETEYAVGVIPLGGYVKISGMSPHEDLPEEVERRAYLQMPVWKRIVVIAAGPFVNIMIALIIFAGLFLFVGTSEPTTKIGSLEKNAAAAGALRSGDQLVSIDGVSGDPAALRQQIGKHRCAG